MINGVATGEVLSDKEPSVRRSCISCSGFFVHALHIFHTFDCFTCHRCEVCSQHHLHLGQVQAYSVAFSSEVQPLSLGGVVCFFHFPSATLRNFKCALRVFSKVNVSTKHSKNEGPLPDNPEPHFFELSAKSRTMAAVDHEFSSVASPRTSCHC